MNRLLLSLLIMTACLCCGPSYKLITVNGFQVADTAWAADSEKLRKRASFDFQCSESELTLRLLAISHNTPQQVGVTGCGRQGVYVDPALNGMWIANSEGPSPDAP